MPALPFYLLGIRDILEIDSVDETDSFRKCGKAHKGTINLSCILYPEKLSADGKNTVYHALDSLGIENGAEIEIEADGDDAAEAVKVLIAHLKNPVV